MRVFCLGIAGVLLLSACSNGGGGGVGPYETYSGLIDELTAEGLAATGGTPTGELPLALSEANYSGAVELSLGLLDPETLAGAARLDVDFDGGTAFGNFSEFHYADDTPAPGTLETSALLEADGTFDLAVTGSLDLRGGNHLFDGTSPSSFFGPVAEFAQGSISGDYRRFPGDLPMVFDGSYIAARD